MLELKPNCKRCGKELLKESTEAFICSHECAYCSERAERELYFTCPDCQGNLCPRPSRVENSEAQNVSIL